VGEGEVSGDGNGERGIGVGEDGGTVDGISVSGLRPARLVESDGLKGGKWGRNLSWEWRVEDL